MALTAVEIEGEHYWDGGLVSNTPLQWVVENEVRRDTVAFQVDLWNARGEFPRTMFDVMDFRTFAKIAKSAAEMTDMLRVRNPNAIGFPAPDGLFDMSTEVATGEIALVG